jgi:hypothetical protein
MNEKNRICSFDKLPLPSGPADRNTGSRYRHQGTGFSSGLRGALPAPAQRVIVVYKPVPVMVRQRGGSAGASGSSSGGSSSGGSSSGGSSSGGSSGGSVGDVFKQALGDFAKSAIDGLLKLPSK